MARRPKPLVQVDGLRQLRKTLRQAGDDLSDLKEVNRKAADTAAGGATKAVPRLSGLLQSNIRSSGTKTAGIIRAGSKKVPYAGPIHWGWKDRNIKANPFLSKGAKDTEPAWLPLYEKEIDEILSKVKGK